MVRVMTDIATLTAGEIVRLFRRRALSPVEATSAVLRRIEALEPLLNTYAATNADAALAMARDSEARWLSGTPRGPLDGVPVSIKDLVLTRGLPTRRGTRVIPPDAGTEDAPIAARLREGGAVILGKTTVSEFAWKGTGDSPATGVTRNPWDVSRTSGASSAGAAAGLAAGLAVLATGSDGGGSIRIPASFCGVYGFKPTYGLVPSYPPSPVGTLSHLGPMARTVSDAALMLNVIARPDARDWYALPPANRDFTIGLEAPLRGRRVAFSPDLGYARVDPEVAAVVEAAASVFADLGAQLERVERIFPEPIDIYRPLFLAAFAQIARPWSDAQLNLLDSGLRDVVRAGRSVTLERYMKAIAARERFGIAAQQFFESFDLLLTPTLPIAAFPIGRDTPEPTDSVPSWLDWNPFTYPFNLSQQPAASVPCGFLANGLPVGLQIIGPKYADGLVLNASRAFEAARPFRMPDIAAISARTATRPT
jgi:aspartyl-tRNA(Asn)/glutamyl-tRNA(Gln) amidotransferase subunit A